MNVGLQSYEVPHFSPHLTLETAHPAKRVVFIRKFDPGHFQKQASDRDALDGMFGVQLKK